MAAWQGLGNCTVGLRQFQYYDQERKASAVHLPGEEWPELGI